MSDRRRQPVARTPPRAPAGNVVDTDCARVAELAKRHLGRDAVVADGLNGRVRETAAEYLARR